MRSVCLWCPDWPVVSLRRAGRAPAHAPVVVLERDRVRAVSPEARAEGVRRGSRRREAEARCPGAELRAREPSLEARAFEAVARRLDDVTPRLAVIRPGLLSFPAAGPSRYFGGDEALVERAREVLGAEDDGRGGRLDVRAGVAGTAFAAHTAARRTEPSAPLLVLTDGETPDFLAARSVVVLSAWEVVRVAGRVGAGPGTPGAPGTGALAELSGLLARLGLATLGDLAALPEAAVADRFGPVGVVAHRLARGSDDLAVRPAEPPPELAEATELDPPARRVDVAAFAAKGLADRLLDGLERRGLVCTLVLVEAGTGRGERRSRSWRHEGGFTAPALAERVRWQLEAWLAPVREREVEDPVGGLTLLRLVPEEVVDARGRQLGFWGGDARAADRAERALARVQGMLGRGAVVVPALWGGRTPGERAAWLPWDPTAAPGPLAPGDSRAKGPGTEDAPWPGSVPPPAPARVPHPPLPAALSDSRGRAVRVSGRGELSAPPARVECEVVRAAVDGWAGPWVHDVRWWDPARRRRRALFQVVAGGVALLLSIERGEAAVEAVYD